MIEVTKRELDYSEKSINLIDHEIMQHVFLDPEGSPTIKINGLPTTPLIDNPPRNRHERRHERRRYFSQQRKGKYS